MDSGKSEEQTRPPVPEGSCHFFIERKKRYCRFKPAKDSSFCAEHATTFQVNMTEELLRRSIW